MAEPRILVTLVSFVQQPGLCFKASIPAAWRNVLTRHQQLDGNQEKQTVIANEICYLSCPLTGGALTSNSIFLKACLAFLEAALFLFSRGKFTLAQSRPCADGAVRTDPANKKLKSASLFHCWSAVSLVLVLKETKTHQSSLDQRNKPLGIFQNILWVTF